MLSKIDRVLGNALCTDAFPTAEAFFLPEEQFDHSPVLVKFFHNTPGKRPFRFCNHWATQEGFLDIVQECWRTQISGYTNFQISQKLHKLKNILKAAFHKELSLVSLQKIQSEYQTAQDNLHLHPNDLEFATVE